MQKLILMSILYAPLAMAIRFSGAKTGQEGVRKMTRWTFAFYVIWVLIGPTLYLKYMPPPQ